MLPLSLANRLTPLRVYFAERPLREAHLETLRLTHERATNISQQAAWSNKGVAKVASEILANLSDEWVMNRLLLDVLPGCDQEKLEKQKDATLFFRLCVSMASQRCWSVSPQWVCQPDNWLGILDSDLELAAETKKRIEKDAEIVLDAVSKAYEKDASCDHQAYQRENHSVIFFSGR